MARKLTRYKVNRQYRKNPTRSRVFFPYILPFQPDFRTTKVPDANKLKNQFAKRARDYVKNAIDEKNPDLYRSVRRKVAHAAEAVSRGYVKQSEKASKATGKAVIEAAFYRLYPEAILPVGMAQLGIDMLRHPDKYNRLVGGGGVALTAVGAYMFKKGIRY